MEYTVQKLGKLAGVSTRTLRYYDEIGILTPARINSSGYRIYGEKEVKMSDIEKFQGFKKNMIDDNERKYGSEIRKKYGKDTIEKSNAKVMNMTEQQYDDVTKLASQLTITLAEAFKNGDPASVIAQEAADLHKKWLTYYWSEYTVEAHAGLAQMYVDDERFTAYYDKEQPGTAAFLRDAVLIYTGMKK